MFFNPKLNKRTAGELIGYTMCRYQLNIEDIYQYRDEIIAWAAKQQALTASMTREKLTRLAGKA
jgi:hypothetical protein